MEGLDIIISLISIARQKMATIADGQWNQRDELRLSPDSEMNGKLVNNSTLHDPKILVLKLSITNDFFSFHIHILSRGFGWRPRAAVANPSPELVGWQSLCSEVASWLREALQILQRE